jgi:hypothetical protein
MQQTARVSYSSPGAKAEVTQPRNVHRSLRAAPELQTSKLRSNGYLGETDETIANRMLPGQQRLSRAQLGRQLGRQLSRHRVCNPLGFLLGERARPG